MALDIVRLDDFSGGLDLVSDLSEVAPPFTPYAENFRVSEGGKALVGAGRDEASAGSVVSHDCGTGTAGVGYYGNLLDYYAALKSDGSVLALVLARQGSWQTLSFTSSSISAVSRTSIRTAMSTGSAVMPSFAMHNDKLYGLDPLNNIGVWDGTTLTTAVPGVDTGPPKGIILGIYDGKMFVAVANGSGALGLTIQWSEPFDATNGFINTVGLWPAANTVTLGGSAESGERIVRGFATPDGLAVFTTGGLYLIYDSDTGANTLVDRNGGTRAWRSLVQDKDGTIYGVNHRGIFRTNGRQPVEYVSKRVEPLFRTGNMGDPEFSQYAAACIYDGSYWVSWTSWRNSGNNEYRWGLELDLASGAIMYHSCGVGDAVFYLPIPLHKNGSAVQIGPMLMVARRATTASDADAARLLFNTLQTQGYTYRGAYTTYSPFAATVAARNLSSSYSPSFAYALPYVSQGRMIRARDVRVMARALTGVAVGIDYQRLEYGAGYSTGLPAEAAFDFEHPNSWNNIATALMELSSGRARIQGVRGDALAPVLRADYTMAYTYAAGPPVIRTVELGLMVSGRRYS